MGLELLEIHLFPLQIISNKFIGEILPYSMPNVQLSLFRKLLLTKISIHPTNSLIKLFLWWNLFYVYVFEESFISLGIFNFIFFNLAAVYREKHHFFKILIDYFQKPGVRIPEFSWRSDFEDVLLKGLLLDAIDKDFPVFSACFIWDFSLFSSYFFKK